MKKIIALALAALMLFAMAACGNGGEDTTAADDPNKEVEVMTFEEYMAAELDAPVVIETYVQATQSWWDNKITVYAQGTDGAYLMYNMTCTQEDAAKLVPGVKIRVTGFKTEWMGLVEIAEGATFEFVDEDDTYIVTEAFDATALLGTDDLIKHQNEFVAFKGMTIKSISYKNNEPGDDIYLTFTKGEADYEFCVEYYLTGRDSDVYKAVENETVKVGDVVDIEGFLYWYSTPNTHVTSIKIAE